MNKLVLLLLILPLFINSVAAQEADGVSRFEFLFQNRLMGITPPASHFSAGVGIEGNMNSPKGMAAGGTFSIDYSFLPKLALGLKLGFSHNFAQIMTLEPTAFFRWYFMYIRNCPIFAQADLGASVIFKDAKAHPAFQGGLNAGIRIPLADWYIEPYLRGGYPFIWGFGLTTGYRF
jgi:hypothetical protein